MKSQVVQFSKWNINIASAFFQMPREWNTPIREPWNAPIHNTLKAIDNHTQEYFKSGDIWHLQKADQLRQYLHELKTWIHMKESR